MSTRDSQATFALSARLAIRNLYHNRCTICLTKLTNEGSHCAHLFDLSSSGRVQIDIGVQIGTIPKDYIRSSPENGTIQCPTCHLGLFTPGYVALSPPREVLQYIYNYLSRRGDADRRPLHEFFLLLVRGATGGEEVNLPDFTAIKPYLGLYTLVSFRPQEIGRIVISTPHLPNLSTIQDNQFGPAPANTLPTALNVARIFDALSLPDDAPNTPGIIPLSPSTPGFEEERYWRLPVKQGVILELLMQRASSLPLHSHSVEVQLAQHIKSLLIIQSSSPGDSNFSAPGPSGSGGGAGAGRKRKRDGDGDDDAPSDSKRGRGKAKAKAKAEAEAEGGADEGMDAIPSNESEPADDLSIGSTTSAVNEDTPTQHWEFGPSLTTNEIIFYARATILV